MPSSPSITSNGYTKLLPGGGGGEHRSTWSAWRRPGVVLPVFALGLLTLFYLFKTNPEDGGSTFSLPTTAQLHDSLDRWSSKHGSSSSLYTHHGGGEFDCNPFAATGRLHVDVNNPTTNVWTPYDTTCKPSNYLKSLFRPADDPLPLIPPSSSSSTSTRQFLPWLMNRTIVIHGDSIDRFHLKDFCTFVGGSLTLITPDHPASPKPYKRPHEASLGIGGEETEDSLKKGKEREGKEQYWEGRPKEGWELTNPWVCDVEEYGTTIVNVFTWGLEGAEEFFETERWYYPPATWVERLDAITTPLLEGLAKAMDRPQIVHPDLVELNSGFWDLRKYTEEDFVAAGFLYRPYPEDSPIPYTNLSPEREVTWEREARKAIKQAAKAFRGKDGKTKSGPTLLWRSLHHPPRHNYAPFPRVFALDSLARKVVHDLRYESATRSPPPPTSFEPRDEEDLNLDERLRIDESGALMLGQEHMFRDLLHPLAVPGSYLWGNVMLYELKRAVERVGRSS